MAKDKGTKPTKETKPAKGDDEFAKPSEAPATGGDGWKFEAGDNLGKLFLIMPLREDEIDDKFSKQPGAVKGIIIADIVELNEKQPAKSELHEDAYVFGGWVKGSLRGYIGERKVLGRLGQGPLDRGNTPWILEDADDDDVAIAKAYLAEADPFKAGSGDKVKPGKADKVKSKGK